MGLSGSRADQLLPIRLRPFIMKTEYENGNVNEGTTYYLLTQTLCLAFYYFRSTLKKLPVRICHKNEWVADENELEINLQGLRVEVSATQMNAIFKCTLQLACTSVAARRCGRA